MKPYTYVVMLRFSNGVKETVYADNVADVLAAARELLAKNPKVTVVDMDVDTVFDSPRVQRGEA